MNYRQAERYLLGLLGGTRRSNFGLGRIAELIERLNRPDRAYRIIHVAGTNGKGSTAAMIESGLRAAGFSTGFYSSPHLTRFNERFRIDGREIDDDGFVRAVECVRAAAEAMLATGFDNCPTLFEATTAAALWSFREARVDWTILEVGLGGRLDATNVVDADLAVITPIDLDHERLLGRGPEAIAREKAGILKPGRPAVIAPQREAAMRAIERRSEEIGATALALERLWRLEGVEASADGRFRFRTRREDGLELEVRVGLAGEHQVVNARTAAAALAEVGAPAEAITAGLRNVVWPGRLETVPGRPDVLLDCAHNPAGARALAAFLERFHSRRRIHLIYGASRDKAVEEVAGLLFGSAERVTLTRAKVSRSLSPEALEAVVDHHHTRIERAASIEAALERAKSSAAPEDLIVVAGSVFLVGEARQALTLPAG